MAFQTPIPIYTAMKNISNKKYLLPAIQREFVWSENQIERLFDSVMRGYAIGSFLFWKVNSENIGKYQFYNFIQSYHQNKSHNEKASVIGFQEIISILDGQQRLTALFIGLKGDYASKIPYMHRNNPAAYPKKQLYLNILSRSQDEDLKYDFKFLPHNVITNNEKQYWYKVGDILQFDPDEPHKIYSFLNSKGLTTSDFAGECLFKLCQVIMKSPIINYYMEEEQNLDKVLNIFIRINSGGTILSYSDLLLSIATAQWDEKDAREEIINFVDEINKIGVGFEFNKDFILKTSLILCDFKDIRFRVDNFNKHNMGIIQNNWDKIKDCIRASVDLISMFGFNSQTLISNNAIIPIIYYLFKSNNYQTITSSSKHQQEREKIRKWLHKVLLKQTFGGQSDNTLRIIRDVISSQSNYFPEDEIDKKLRGVKGTISFSEEEIEELLEFEYGKRYTFSILSLLCPHLDYNNVFHQDHIHPKSYFKNEKTLLQAGIKQVDIEFYMENYNKISNLQLLEGNINTSKNSKDFKAWLNETYMDTTARETFKDRHYIHTANLSFSNFKQFYNDRHATLKTKLKSELIK